MRTLLTSYKRACEQHGREVVLVPEAVSGFGAEASLAGTEPGALTVKGFFHEPEAGKKPPAGEIDVMRLADAEGGELYDWLFRTAAAYFGSEPTAQWRLVDGEKTYAVVKVRPVYRRQVAVAYGLLLRLI